MLEDPILLADWHVVARVSEVVSGEVRALRLLGRDLVLWRNAEGIQVWQDLCVHRGAKLSRGTVEHECLVCPYHGWNYDTAGACVRIPAHPEQVPPPRARANVCHTRERYGLVWVCLGEPKNDVPAFPEWDDASYRKIHVGPYVFKAHGPRVVENFLDVGHFPYVHAGYLGDPQRPEIQDYKVESGPDGVIARDIPVWQPNPDGSGKPGVVLYTYQALRPLTASFVKDQKGERYCMIDIVTPIDENESRAWGILAFNYPIDSSDEELRQFQDTVAGQDVPVVESQRPEMLPLDLQEELHLRSDRTAIAYRLWLRTLGLTYGVN
jgi:phenylpropionate dioxygenase-like ring-hydroxylating dioxygenase large terminal subunit